MDDANHQPIELTALPASDLVVAHGMIERSPSIAGLAAALAKAQGAMKPATKDSTNPHFGNKYADLASVWDAAREQLSSNGLSVMQFPTEGLSGRLALTTMLTHASGEWIATTFSTKLQKDDAQGIGSAITYLRRYALAAVVGVVADLDDDGNAAAGNGGNGNARSSAGNQRAAASGNGRATSGTRQTAAAPRQDAPKADQTTVSGKVVGVFRAEDGSSFAIQLDGAETKHPAKDIEHAQRAKAAKESGGAIALTLDSKGLVTASALADGQQAAA